MPFWKVAGLAACSIMLAAGAARADRFEIREYSGMPCLWQNGLPYFTEFDSTGREVSDLAGQWKFTTDPGDAGEAGGYSEEGFDDSGWDTATVPGVWNARDSELALYEGAAWYRRGFEAPERGADDLCRLYFDGVTMHGKVWLNGRYLGEHSGGYSAWSVDASEALRAGENTLAVLVDNRRDYTDIPPKLWELEKAGWWIYGGIARVARLECSAPVSVNKLVIEARPLGDSRGELGASGLVYNHSDRDREVVVSLDVNPRTKHAPPEYPSQKITAPAGDCARFDFPSRVMEGAYLWENDNPVLHGLEVAVAEDGNIVERAGERFGFREFEIRSDGLYLNGEYYWLRGMNRHEDDPATGLYQSDERMNRDMALLKELNVNHMRPGHYPNDTRWLDLCDREGITITEEIPLYQASNGLFKWAEHVFLKGRGLPDSIGGGYKTRDQMIDPDMLANAEQQLVEMIERDRNHPSIIMWSVGNENWTFSNKSRVMYETLIDTARRFDPGRPVAVVVATAPVLTPAFEKAADMADVIHVNEYYGWYYGKADGVAGLLDKFHEKYPDKLIVVSEFGAGTEYGRHRDPPEKFSEEYQAYIFETHFRHLMERPYVVGAMPWVFSDFRCAWFEDEHPIYHMNLKGLVDYERNKKMAFDTVADIYAEIEARDAGEP